MTDLKVITFKENIKISRFGWTFVVCIKFAFLLLKTCAHATCVKRISAHYAAFVVQLKF